MGLPEHWVAALFARLQVRYGYKWVGAMEGIEETAVAEWAAGLAGLTGEQIARGLNCWREAWPPSLPEFRDACEGKRGGKNEYGLDYVPECYRQQPITERSRLLSSDERDARRQSVQGQIKSLRDALRGKQSDA